MGRSRPSACAQAAAHQTDVVILDLVMPGMGGLEALTAMRAQGLAAPVIVLTATGGVETVVKAMQAGAQDYLPKRDASAKPLWRAIWHAIERHQVREVLAEARKPAPVELRFKTSAAEPLRSIKTAMTAAGLKDLDMPIENLGPYVKPAQN